MLMLTRHVPVDSVPASGFASLVVGELRLDYDQRLKRRARFNISAGPAIGREVGLDLPRGHVLRDGDLLVAEDGADAVVVRAAVQPLLQVRSDNWLLLSRIAYHLGNRHVPLAILEDKGAGILLLQLDHVLEQMVSGLGVNPEVISAVFDPEAGAYHSHAGAHQHAALAPESAAGAAEFDRRHAPVIHDFLDPHAAPVKR